MELTKNEKEGIITVLQQHLDEIKDVEKLQNQQVRTFAGEMKYEEFLERIIKKLGR